MKWTKDRPTTAGLYWWFPFGLGKNLPTVVFVNRRAADAGPVDTVYFFMDEKGESLTSCTGYWSGPIDLPERPSEITQT
jgi:hypothetical protein